MITIWERIKMEPTELRIRYTEIIKKYNSHFELGDYEVAFLLSQSLFEDRLNVYWILGSWHTKSVDYWDMLKPEPNETKKVSLMSKTHNLRDWEMIDNSQFIKWRKLIQKRNDLIHFSLFNIEEYTKEVCDDFFNSFRSVDKLISSFKIKTNFYNESK